MHITFYHALPKEYEEDIWNILCEADKDFIPALSSRNNPTQTNGLTAASAELDSKPTAYFKELRTQLFILAIHPKTNRVMGFLTFRHGYSLPELDPYNPSNYATTSCVAKSYRNQGVAKALYQYFEEQLPAHYQSPYITRRTWSTNTPQIHLFNKKGFSLVYRIPNHRGEGIDTVYYAKKMDKE